MAEKARKTPAGKGRKEGPAHAAECPNLGCRKVPANGEIDIPVDGTILHCPDDEDETGRYEFVWRVKNTLDRAAYAVGYREGYKDGTGAQSLGKVTAKKHEWLCGSGYLEGREIKEFELFVGCRDKKCS